MSFCQFDSIALRHQKVPLPLNEGRRIEILRETQLLDSNERDPLFDRFTSLGRRTFGTEICLISLVDVDRQWFKSRVGLSGNQTDRNSSFCSYACLPQSSDIFLVLNALDDPRFCNNPLVLGPPHIRFYAGARLIVSGVALGSFCIIDSHPRTEFSLSDQMLLLAFGAMVSNAIVMKRSQEYRLQDKINRPLHMKCYASMNLLSLKHNLRTPLSTLLIVIQNLKTESERTFCLAYSKLLKNSWLIEKYIEISLQVIEEITSESSTIRRSDSTGLTYNSYGETACLSNILLKIEKLISSISKFDFQRNEFKILLTVTERSKALLETFAAVNAVRVIERTYPQLMLINVVITLCHALRFVYEVPGSELLVELDMEEDEYQARPRNSSSCDHSGALDKIVKKTGRIYCRVTAITPSSSSSGASEVDQKVLHRMVRAQYQSELNRLLYLIGGGVSVRNTEGKIELGCWVPFSVSFFQSTVVGQEVLRNIQSKKIRVLLVDDSQIVYDQFQGVLDSQNFELTWVTNGVLGLIQLRNATNIQSGKVLCSYDIVFVDLLMPTKSGCEMMKDYSGWILEQLQATSSSLKNNVLMMEGTTFIALQPPYTTFEEMQMFEVDKCDDGDESKVASPADYGFRQILNKPIQTTDLMEFLMKYRKLASEKPKLPMEVSKITKESLSFSNPGSTDATIREESPFSLSNICQCFTKLKIYPGS